VEARLADLVGETHEDLKAAERVRFTELLAEVRNEAGEEFVRYCHDLLSQKEFAEPAPEIRPLSDDEVAEHVAKMERNFRFEAQRRLWLEQRALDSVAESVPCVAQSSGSRPYSSVVRLPARRVAGASSVPGRAHRTTLTRNVTPH
jgi:hypothetical protein